MKLPLLKKNNKISDHCFDQLWRHAMMGLLVPTFGSAVTVTLREWCLNATPKGEVFFFFPKSTSISSLLLTLENRLFICHTDINYDTY